MREAASPSERLIEFAHYICDEAYHSSDENIRNILLDVARLLGLAATRAESNSRKSAA